MKKGSTRLRLRIPGVAALTVFLAVLAGGLSTLSAAATAVGALGLLLWALCRWLASRQLEGIRIERRFPRRAFTGESFPAEAFISSGPGFLGARDVACRDALASSGWSRHFHLAPGTGEAFAYAALLRRRGPCRERRFRLRSRWPLGFFEAERTLAAVPAGGQGAGSPLVRPRPHMPPRLRRHLERAAAESMLAARRIPDPGAEFRLLREFRPGDAVRRVHWPSSLRSGTLLVRETDPPGARPLRRGIVIHSLAAPGRLIAPESFEMILRIAAALLLRFGREETEVRFRCLPDGPMLLRGPGGVSAALDRLAVAERRGLAGVEALHEEAAAGRDCDEVFVLSDCPLEHWEPGLRQLLPAAVCLDAATVALSARPALRTRRALAS